MKNTFSLIICILFFTNLLPAQKNNSEAETAIRHVIEQQAQAWNRGDIEGFMQGYWRSEKLVFVSGMNVTRGWRPTLDRYKKSYDTRAKMGMLKFSDLEITLLSKDAAVVLGSWELTDVKDNPKGKFTLTFRKLKEGWRIVIDLTS
ncbi:MAG: DUF4440 domain-containing protein [Pyrinomonadaceae bacterium]